MEEYRSNTQPEETENYQIQSQQPQQPLTPPKSWLWQSIVVTIVCLWPFGIPAIIFASKVEREFRAGRYQAALDASRNAKKWTMISFFGGLAVFFLIFILALIGAFDGLDSFDYYY
ncbi:MAG: CD225/dispanin family protein [Rikenellaceae bacterium]|nr:CD225/dispanin family protein [Rikenellaceae bacterium]